MSELTSDLLFIIIVLVVTAVLGILTGHLIGLLKSRNKVKLLKKKMGDLEADLILNEKGKNEIEAEANALQERYDKRIAELEMELSSRKEEANELETKASELETKASEMETKASELETKASEMENKASELETRTDNLSVSLEKQVSELENELSSFREEKVELEEKTRDLAQALEEVKSVDRQRNIEQEIASQAVKTGPRIYNLKIIEGIGPKIEQILKEEGIDSFVKLSHADPDEIRTMLIRNGGSAFRVHDPRSWPEQAKLAADEEWTELKEYQEKLIGGK